VQRSGPFLEEQLDVPVGGHDGRLAGLDAGQFGIDALEGGDEGTRAGAGRQDAILEIAVGCGCALFFLFSLFGFHLGVKTGLGTARASRIPLCCSNRNMLQIDFRREKPVGPVGEFQGQGAPDHAGSDLLFRDREQSEAGAGRAVHPAPEGIKPGPPGKRVR
jgi:hypothetical protein